MIRNSSRDLRFRNSLENQSRGHFGPDSFDTIRGRSLALCKSGDAPKVMTRGQYYKASMKKKYALRVVFTSKLLTFMTIDS